MEDKYFKNLGSISGYDNYEKYSNEMYTNNTTKEDSFIKNNDNQLLQNKEIKSILDSKFYLIKKIGEGSSGKVYLGVQKDSLNGGSDEIAYYSIKIMNNEKIELNMFKNEIELLKKINHKNVCKIFSYGCGPKIYLNKTQNKKPKEYYYIVMEYLEHRELLKYITNVVINENIGFGENFGKLIFSQLLDGLEAIHNLNICHWDIKLNNIILGENDYIIKYVDFGFAIENQGKLRDFLGTPSYVAPEILLKRFYYGKSGDIFSLGIMLFILVTGKLPFKIALPNDNLYKYIIRGDYVEFWKRKNMNISSNFMELFDNMIAFDYTQRPSISEIRQSNWMKEINYELMPLLKQEFILRKEKMNYNKFNASKMMDEKKCINEFGQNTIKINLNDGNNEEPHIINKDNECNNKNKAEGNILTNLANKNLFNLLYKIKKYLKKEGFVKFGGNTQNHEHNATNGDIEVFLNLQRYKLNYIILNYSLKGPIQYFEKFLKLLPYIKKILEN